MGVYSPQILHPLKNISDNFFDNFPTAQNLDPLCPFYDAIGNSLLAHMSQYTSLFITNNSTNRQIQLNYTYPIAIRKYLHWQWLNILTNELLEIAIF